MTKEQAVQALENMSAVGTIAKVNLQPSDVIVLETEHFLGPQERDYTIKVMKDVWPDHRVVVVEGGNRIKVMASVSQWMPIATAPKDGRVPIMIAEFTPDGELRDIDFDAVFEAESESWELPEVYYCWKSAYGRVENPTHWMYVSAPIQPVTDTGLVKVGPGVYQAPDVKSIFDKLP